MARGDRERVLGELLKRIGHQPSTQPAPQLSMLSKEARGWVMDLYRQLGGVQDAPALAPGNWDHPFAGLIVELDEEQHFNRYRSLTLTADWAHQLPWQVDYLGYATIFEPKALSRNGSGGFWTSPRAEAQFGKSDPPRQLDGNGSARWKQRAIYDAMRDIMAATGQVNLARVSVYDNVGGHALSALLRDPQLNNSETLDALDAHIRIRTLGLTSRMPALSRHVVERTDGHADVAPSPTSSRATRMLDPLVPALSELAHELGLSPKTVRAELRREFRPEASQRGPRWDPLSPAMVAHIRDRFSRTS